MGMELELIEFVYFACFFLGLGFAILSGLLSGVFTGGAEAHVDAGGADGHVDGGLHFPILSPVTLAMFVATFGGSGLIFRNVFKMAAYAHIPLAAVAAVGVALAVAWVFYKIMGATQSSSLAAAEEALGAEAEVTVPIPHEGLGEIAYTLRGSRFTNPARTADGKELPARAIVKIVKLVGNTYIVQKTQ